MMALELLDTKWAGVIQPDPAPPKPARLKPSTYWPRPTDRAAPSRSGSASVPRRLARLLEDVGFAEIECFGDLDGAALAWGWLVVRARKPIT